MKITDEEMKVLLKSQQGEADAVLMYTALAKAVKDPGDAETFRTLAAEEGHHASVFRGLTNQVLKPKKTMAFFLPKLYRILGKKRLYPLIAKGEYAAEKNYEPVALRFEEIQSVKDDEKRHGDTVMNLLK
ncbi:MAG: rubrerythrin [Clostridia bacterium]|nr:rubrerythrin [Clostridia bacterium]